MTKIDLTEQKAKQSPQGGVLVGKKDGQTIIYDDGKVGGWFVGKTHKEGGIQGIDKTSGQPIEVQTGEVIITAPALADQSKREFQGKMMTNREILSKINSDAGGVAFAEDGMEISNKALYKGSQYSYGGKMMSDKDIVDEINKCGCEHNEKYDEGGLIAPNGKPSNLTPEQYKLVRTPKFKAWFGDWENDPKNASKVVDENGEPLVVYHGTYVENPFYIFDFDKADLGFHFGTYEQAKNRSETQLFFKGHKSIVNSFFLNIKKIFEITDVGEFEYPQRYIDELVNDNIISEEIAIKKDFFNAYYREDNKKIRNYLLKKYDNQIGFKYNNKYEAEGKSFIVLEPTQIKLADGTNTTFDSNNEDIRFENGGHLSLGMSLEDIAKMHNVTLEELDKQVEIGMKDESIHSGNYKDHFNIVKDHLVESPTFYTDEQKAQEEYADGGYITYKDKYNKKYNYDANSSHSLEEISKDTGVSMKGLQQIYNKGIGAYKTNPSSVRPNVKSKEQWAMARVYSAVMGGADARVDANELNMNYGGEIENISKDKFNQGYGKVKYFELTSNGGKWSYINNPNVSRSQRDKMPTYTIENDKELMSESEKRKENYKLNQPKDISILDFAKKFSDKNNGKIFYKSDSGSVYVRIGEKEIRISDHYILDRDSMNPKSRYDLEIVQKGFDEKTPTNLDYWDNEFKNGGRVHRESLVRDAKSGNTPARDLNNYNDMLDVQADGQVGGDTGIFEDGGKVGKVLTPIVSNWNDVPSNWKDTKKVKKVIWANNPYDKGLYSIVTPFLGDDEYRPIMDGINFDKNGITCTDAHKLITLPYPNKDYDGVYNADLSKKKDSEQVKIDGKYPNYEAIIPESKNTVKYLVDVYKLLQYTNIALKYSNKTTLAVNYKIYDAIMGFNGKYLIEELNTLLKLGHEKIYAHFIGYTKAFVFSPAKDYELGNDELLLIMPVMVNGENYLGAKDLDYNRELSVYYDFNDNEIHNADGSIAEFKMSYESNSALSPEDVKPFENMIKKSKNYLPILDNVSVQNGIARTTNLDSEFELNGVNLPDGIYNAKNGTLEITMEAIEDFPTRPIFEVDEYTIQFSIPSPVLEYYVDKLKLVVGKDELRPAMMGICLHHTSDNKLFLASTDANILLKIDITQYVDMPILYKDLKTIIEPKYLYDYLNAVEETTLFIKSNRVGTKIDSNKWSFYCRNIDENFPNYDAVIPRESNKLISVDLSEIRNCLNSDFAKQYESESNNKDGIFVFNHEHQVYIGTFDRYARENKKEKIEKLCTANISVKEDYFYYNDQSILLIMPVMTDDENVNFSFGKKILQRVISIVSDKKLEMHYSELNRAYLVPIHSFDYKKTTKEHKVKEQKLSKEETKLVESVNEVTEIKDAIETIEILMDGATAKDKKEYKEALEVLHLLLETYSY